MDNKPDNYIFMSFYEPNRSLGVCIVKADNINEALVILHDKQIHPGGEVLFRVLNNRQFREEDLKLNKVYAKIRNKSIKRTWKSIFHSTSL